MTVSQWAQGHHRSILFAIIVFAAAGLFASFHIPVSLFPRVTFPRVVVNVDAGDRPAERMAVQVTRIIEQAARSVPGVNSIRSNTSRGSADVSINFNWGVDMVSAMLQVESAINQITGALPAGTTFELRRMDPTVFPVLGYSLTSNTHSLVKLRDMALYQIRPVLSTVTGVARVSVLGGNKAEFQIVVDPQKLASFNLSMEDVAAAVSAANVLKAVGRLEQNYKLYLILSNTQFKNIEEIGRTVLRSNTSGVVYLDDAATINLGVAPNWTRVTADGQDAVLFQIYQQPGGNTVQIARDCKRKLKEIEKILPGDVNIANWYDQSDLIVASAISVRDALLIGVVLAVVILLIFLRNLKVTMIAAATVPMTLAATVLILSNLGMSFNIMTLGGMAAAVALIIDDAIVMIEHIMRRLRGGTGHYRERISKATVEFTRPLAGSSASTIIIFVPLAFLSGVTGAFFKALSLTMAVGLGISFLLTWIAVPLMANHLLSQKDVEQKEGGYLTWLVHRFYVYTMNRLLPQPLLLLVMVLPFLGLGCFAYKQIGSGFMPSIDEGGFILDYRSKSGTSLSETDRLLRQVGNILRATPEVSTYSRRTGLALGGFLTEANEGDFFIQLKPLPRRSLDEVMNEIRRRVEHEVSGLEIEMAKLMEDIIGDLTAVPQPIEIKLFSDDGNLLQRLAPKIAATIKGIPGVVDVKDGIVPAGDALNIRVDRIKATVEGITVGYVTQTIENYLTGIVATKIQRGPQMLGLRLWVPKLQRNFMAGIRHLLIRCPDGHLVPLSRVASLATETGQPQIVRDNLKRMVAVTGRISGRDMGSTVHDVITKLDKPGLLPKGVYYTLGGLYEQQRIAFRAMLIVFIGAVALVFTLLLFLYESFRVALSMMINTLITVAAVFVGLWLTHTDLNIMSMMGMTMVIGIVTEVAIFIYSEFNGLSNNLAIYERLILAGKNRMRPIAMTTIAAIFALAPLAFGIGEGSGMLRPLAIAIISGLVVQLPLTLIVLPSLLAVLTPAKRKKILEY